MSGLISSLLSNTRTLNTHMAQVETAGRNIANVNNPNYARQRVVTGSIGSLNTRYGSVSMGMDVIALTQVRNAAIDQQILKETMSQGYLQAQRDANSMLESYLTETIGNSTGLESLDSTSSDEVRMGGLASQVDSFFMAFEELSATPNQISAKQEVYSQANQLTNRLNSMDQQLTDIDNALTATLESDLTAANSLLNDIADLNYQISKVEAGGRTEAYDLRSNRQEKLEALASYMDFSVTPNTSNDSMIDIRVNAVGGGTVDVLRGTYTTSDLSFNTGTNQVEFGTPGTALDITSGSVPGHLETKTSTIPEFRATLDALSEEIVTSVNAAYNPTGLGDLFDAAGITAGSIQLAAGVSSSNIRSSENAGGGNEIATAVANLREMSFSTTGGDAIDGSFKDVVLGINTQAGLNAANSSSQLESQSTVLNYLTTQRENASGVSLDEETADLIRFQRAYEASARVVSILDEMLNVLVNSTG